MISKYVIWIGSESWIFFCILLKSAYDGQNLIAKKFKAKYFWC